MRETVKMMSELGAEVFMRSECNRKKLGSLFTGEDRQEWLILENKELSYSGGRDFLAEIIALFVTR